MTPRELEKSMQAALPMRAQQALLLARQFDRGVDPAAAFIIVNDHPAATTAALALALRSQARRDRRAGGAHGPVRFSCVHCEFDAAGEEEDPAELVAAAQELAKRPGLAAALSQQEPAYDARALARQEHITLRRAQQILQARLRAEECRQGVLL